MIYLDSSIITIPNLLNIDSSSYVLEIRNNLTNEVIVQDTSNISENDLYYQFAFDSSALLNNEYTITLFDDSSTTLGSFLAQKGIDKSEKDVFNCNTQYISFEN